MRWLLNHSWTQPSNHRLYSQAVVILFLWVFFSFVVILHFLWGYEAISRHWHSFVAKQIKHHRNAFEIQPKNKRKWKKTSEKWLWFSLDVIELHFSLFPIFSDWMSKVDLSTRHKPNHSKFNGVIDSNVTSN